jgi:glutathione S-transferase
VKLYERLGADNLCPSPIGYRVRAALAMKGMDCERVPMRLIDVDRLEAATGSRTAPALVDGDRRFGDTVSMVKHLDAINPDHKVFVWQDAGLNLETVEREFGFRAGKVIAPKFLERLCPEDREYFQTSREARFGMTFAELVANRAASELDLAFTISRYAERLEQAPCFSGPKPGFSDTVVYGYLLWIRFVDPSAMPELPGGMQPWFEARDAEWREACLTPFS